jgi:hypothetical protein
MRQFTCIELTMTDALLLRDAIRPLARVEPIDAAANIRLCEKLYDALLRLKIDGNATINVGIDEREALIINHFVSSEDWEGALPLLEQTWLVLYELRNERAYPRTFSAGEIAVPAAEQSTSATQQHQPAQPAPHPHQAA